MKTWAATVAHAEAGTRLDRWLAGRLPDLSRTRLRALIEGGQVRVGGHAVKAAHRLRAGERVEVLIPLGRRATPARRTAHPSSLERTTWPVPASPCSSPPGALQPGGCPIAARRL